MGRGDQKVFCVKIIIIYFFSLFSMKASCAGHCVRSWDEKTPKTQSLPSSCSQLRRGRKKHKEIIIIACTVGHAGAMHRSETNTEDDI